MLPVLVTVTVNGLLAVPIAWLPKASVAGATVNVLIAATAVPLMATGAPSTVTPAGPVAVTVREAFDVRPAVAGVYVTVIVQLAAAAKVAPQVVVREKGTARAPIARPVAATAPSLVTVTVIDGVVPMTALPNAIDDGATTRKAPVCDP
jgi:hypothetical protein